MGGIVFYSTPHKGSEIANLNMITKYFFSPSVEVQELNTDYPLLLELNNYFKGFVEKFKTKVISFGETLPTQHMGVNMTFVNPESSNPAAERAYYSGSSTICYGTQWTKQRRTLRRIRSSRKRFISSRFHIFSMCNFHTMF